MEDGVTPGDVYRVNHTCVRKYGQHDTICRSISEEEERFSSNNNYISTQIKEIHKFEFYIKLPKIGKR